VDVRKANSNSTAKASGSVSHRISDDSMNVSRIGAFLLRFALRFLEMAVPLAVLLALWHLASVKIMNIDILPPPLMVFEAWWGLWLSDLPVDIQASLVHLGVGYGLGALLGVVLAILSARFIYVEAIVDPVVEMLRPIGAIAWIPIAILMFGVGRTVPIFLIFYAAAFPIFLSTLAGIRETDRQLIQAAEMLGASRRMVIMRVVLPGAVPMVLAGARLSLGVGWMAMVAAELIGASDGLGWRIFWYQEFFRMDKVMAVILTIGVLGFLIDAGMRRLQFRLARWNPEYREA
jgi:ABC-type nitrate/sulfonate/bicarbonate transport system permease component